MGNNRVQSRNRRNGWAILFSGVVLFEITLWFWSSGLSYEASTRFFPFATSFWFIIGQIMFLPVALLYGFGFKLLYSRISSAKTWMCLIAISSLLIGAAVYSALPFQRLCIVMGDDAARRVTLKRFITTDSFNDGCRYVGAFLADDEIIQAILKDRSIVKRQAPTRHEFVEIYLNVASQPDENWYWEDKWGDFYRDRGDGLIYFYMRDRLPLSDR